MGKVKAYYTVETALVTVIIISMIFSVILYTLKLYEKVENYGEKCLVEVTGYENASDTMRLERLMNGVYKGKGE